MGNDAWSSQFSAIAQRTTPPEISWLMAQALEVPGLISLAAGFVDHESLPHEPLAAELHDMLSDPALGSAMLQYGTTQGDLTLRQMLHERLRNEGVFHPHAPHDESHYLIGSGSQQILYLAAEALLDPGDIVLLDAPTYFVVLGAFTSHGARTIGIETDEAGMNVDHLAQQLAQLEEEGELHRVKMVYCMSYSTNPQGVTLSESRRRAMVDLLKGYQAKGHHILLLEDAAYRQLCYDAAPPPLISYDEDGSLVVYTESFSKSLSPGLRLGFGVGPKPVMEKMIQIKGSHDFGSSNFSQQILRRVISKGIFDDHIQRLVQRYREKTAFVIAQLQDQMPADVQWIEPSGGFYVWVTLPANIDTGPHSNFFARALAHKVLYVPGALCFSPDRPEAQHNTSMRLAFGMIGEDELRQGIDRLARAIEAKEAAMAH